MVLQYSAVGIQNDVWTCRTRADYKKNLKYIADSIKGAVVKSELDLPVRLVALSEGALSGWAQVHHDYGGSEEGQLEKM